MNIIEAMELCVKDNSVILIDNTGNEYEFTNGELLSNNDWIYEIYTMEDITKLQFTVKPIKVESDNWIKINSRTELMRAILDGEKIKVIDNEYIYDMPIYEVNAFVCTYLGVNFSNYKFEYLEEE